MSPQPLNVYFYLAIYQSSFYCQFPDTVNRFSDSETGRTIQPLVLQKIENMCSYQTLYHNPREGFVIHCRQCNHLQTGFGNICLTLNREGFSSFLKYLRECELKVDHDSQIKTVRIPTPYEGMQLLLTGNEIKRLIHMLDEAETEFKALQLIELFSA